ncbi:MAG TPA: transcriptional regulator [Verrucomicrobiae bacterium]|jgi:cholera toxin transcriptional activator|nr:transcriptional regulator [Verrucomicrobiae bacterium]
METFPQKRCFRFGPFEVEPRSGEMRKQGRVVSLTGQPFEILVMLLERPGEVVLRTEIRDRLWPDGTFVDFDHSLNTAVNRIRDVLGDSATNPRFIETLARRGYRFVAPVEVPTPDETNGAPFSVSPSDPSPQQTVAAPMKNTSAGLLTSAHELPPASARLVRILFLLLQIMYLCFYLISLARLHVVQEIVASMLASPLWAIVLLIVTAIVGIPVRLYLIAAAGFNAPGLRDKFLRLFPLLFPLDELWALAPFLLLAQIGYGLALGLTAILLYVPFAERSLILMGAGTSITK